MQDMVHVKGLSELDKFLGELPAKLQKNVARGSLRAGAKVIMMMAKELVPVSPPSSRNAKRYNDYAGALRDSLRVTTRTQGARVVATIKAGGKTRKGGNAFYASMVEFGTKAHMILVGGSGRLATFANRHSLTIGGRFVGPSVRHPGAVSRPFMRPALDSQAQNAVIATAEYMKNRLATKEGLDTAEITIEGDEP